MSLRVNCEKVSGIARRTAIVIVFAASMATGAHGQAAPNDCCAVGSSVSHPETITGHWEMPRPEGSIVGLSISLGTSAPDQANPPDAVSWRIDSAYILTYVRDGPNVDPRYWSDNTPADMSWDRDHLRLHAVSRDGAASDIDLVFDPAKSQWQGSYTNAGYTGAVVLTRPGRSDRTAPIGTWIPGGYFSSFCVHVAMGADGHLVVWQDVFSRSEQARWVNNVQQPVRRSGWFGDSYEDETPRRVGEGWRFTVGTSWGGENVEGALSADGTFFSGGETHYGNGVTARGNPPVPFTWSRHRADVHHYVALLNITGFLRRISYRQPAAQCACATSGFSLAEQMKRQMIDAQR